MIDLRLNPEEDYEAINSILTSVKTDISYALETAERGEYPDKNLFQSFLNYCDQIPGEISLSIGMPNKDHVMEFLSRVKSLASCVLSSMKASLRRVGESMLGLIEEIKEYVVSIVCKIWNVFSLIFKSLREFSLELGFDGKQLGLPFDGKIGLMFDNPLRS